MQLAACQELDRSRYFAIGVARMVRVVRPQTRLDFDIKGVNMTQVCRAGHKALCPLGMDQEWCLMEANWMPPFVFVP
jgi:hypothetical protein